MHQIFLAQFFFFVSLKVSVSSYARCMYWCLKCIYSLCRVWSILGTCKPPVHKIAQFKGHRLWLHTKKIKYWQSVPAKLRITQGGREQKKVKHGCRDYNDGGLIKYWLAPAAQKVEVLINPKSRRIWLKFFKRTFSLWGLFQEEANGVIPCIKGKGDVTAGVCLSVSKIIQSYERTCQCLMVITSRDYTSTKSFKN